MINKENSYCFFSENINPNLILLDSNEKHHCINVLRFNIDDQVLVTDGKGNLALCKIFNIDNRNVYLKPIEIQKFDKPKKIINLFIGLIENTNKIKLIVEKATELGVNKICFIKAQLSNRKKLNITKLKSISISALKQSKNVYLPKIEYINNILILKNILKDSSLNIVCDFQGQQFSYDLFKDYNIFNIFIGPEGGFSEKEKNFFINNKFYFLKLSDNILTTETAVITAIGLLTNLF